MRVLRALKKIFLLLFIAAAFLLCVSGPLHTAPAGTERLFGSGKIEIAGSRYPSDCESLTAALTAEELPLLDYFTSLRAVDLSGSTCYDELAEWAEKHPDISVTYTLPIFGTEAVSTDTEVLDLSWLTEDEAAEVGAALHLLPKLRYVELGKIGGGGAAPEVFKALREAAPDTEIRFSAVINGETVDNTAQSIDLSTLRHSDVMSTAPILSAMPELQSIELGTETKGAEALTWSDIALIRSYAPEAELLYSFTLYGQELDLDEEELCFKNADISDKGDALFSVLPCLGKCRELYVDSDAIQNETMGKLRELFPQIDINWRIWFGENYSVRTDTEKILASKPTVGGMIYDTSALKYCTRIKYLDLGHNDEMADLSYVTYMPDLEVLIIAMTAITDLSPLRSCPKLEYLEINSTNVADLSPLKDCTQLRHLNIAGCPNITDISMLYGIPLERFWIGCQTPVPEEQAQTFRESQPNCNTNTTTEDPHGESWRYYAYDPEEPKYYWVPRHELLREQMGYNYQEYSFYWLDPDCDMPAPAEYAGMFGKEVYGIA